MAKSLAELKAIRDKKLNEINLRHGKNGYRVEVGIEGVERLAHLCELILRGRSSGQHCLESSRK